MFEGVKFSAGEGELFPLSVCVYCGGWWGVKRIKIRTDGLILVSRQGLGDEWVKQVKHKACRKELGYTFVVWGLLTS